MVSQLVVGTRGPKDSSPFSAHGAHIPRSQPTLTLLVLHCSRCVVPGRPRKVGSGAGPLHLQQVCFIASLQVHQGEASALCCLLRNVNWREKKKSPCVFSTNCHLSAGAYIFELAKLISELHCADPFKLVF